MKITFCAYDGKNITNGINAWHLRILPQLADLGYEIEVILITWAEEDECTLIPQLKSAGILCYIIPKPHFTKNIIYWMLTYINENKPDIWISNQMPQAIFVNKWLKKIGVPSICILHNDDDEYSAIIKDFIAKESVYSPDYVVAVSEILFKKALKAQKLSKIIKIPYGAPIPLNKATHNPDEFRIGYIGRIVNKQKNINKIAKTFCDIVNKIPNTKAFIYGSGPDTLIVQNILMEYGNPETVILAGNLSTEKLNIEILKLHAFVLMSDFEGLPVAMMEAMAYGVVPLCKEIDSGIPELLIDGITGLYIKDNQDIILKIKNLKHNRSEWQLLSDNARNHIIENYSSTLNLKLWIDLLTQMQSKNKNKLIKIPKYIFLPPKNINLHEDIRRPNYIQKFKSRFYKIRNLINKNDK